MTSGFQRDRLTWVAYAMLAWFAYLQAAPGLVVPHLRAELDLSYSVGGLHVAAFAGGSLLAGLASSRLERSLGRRRLLWSAVAVMGAGTLGLVLGTVVAVTIGAILVMGAGGGLVLATVQATLADHHSEQRAVALTEANVAASVSYVVLIGVFSLAAAVGVDWRAALLVALFPPCLVWWANRRLAYDAAAPSRPDEGRLPPAFWVAAVVLMCVTAAEWCVISWGATFADDEVGVSTDTAVALMAGYFGGVVVGRIAGSRLARRHDPSLLLAIALGVSALGFALLWPSSTPVQAVLGLCLLGLGLGNLFPMGVTVAVSLAPGRAAAASGRAVAMTSLAVLLAPLTVGTLADATSLKAALGVVPGLLVVAAAGLVVARRLRRRDAVAVE
jgi:predicted MFS family arabinose efflux permease